MSQADPIGLLFAPHALETIARTASPAHVYLMFTVDSFFYWVLNHQEKKRSNGLILETIAAEMITKRAVHRRFAPIMPPILGMPFALDPDRQSAYTIWTFYLRVNMDSAPQKMVRRLFKTRLSILGAEAPAWREATRARTGRYVTEERQSQAGWIGVPDGRFILISLLKFSWKWRME